MSALDPRATLARDYLDAVRRHKIADRPVSVILRECAELRRQLGEVLDVLSEMAHMRVRGLSPRPVPAGGREPEMEKWLACRAARFLQRPVEAAERAIIITLCAVPDDTAEVVAGWLREAHEAGTWRQS